MEFDEFIRSEWRSVWDEEFWGIDNWVDVASRATGHALVSHFELVTRREELIARLAAATNLEKRRKFVPVTTYKGQDSKYFVPTEYPPIQTADAAFIRFYLDQAVESQFALSLLISETAAFG